MIEAKKPLQTVEPYLNEGRQRYVLVSKFPIFDQDGEVRMVAGVSFDITDRMEAEKALRVREVDLAEAQRLGKIGSWRFDLESGAITWSDELYRIFEISRSDVLTYGSFLNRIHPEDRELVSRTSARARELGTDFDIEYRIILENGEQKIIREEGFVSKDDYGKIKQLFGVAQDITERKEAEKALRKANRQLKNLSQRRIREQEEERRRLSRELHDQMGNLSRPPRSRLKECARPVTRSF